jgi:hypothetical protein
MIHIRKTLKGIGRLCAVLLGLMAILLVGCSSEEPPTRQGTQPPEGFAFFDVGETTPYSEALRERLKKSLGPVAVEYRNIIDLEVNWKDFLKNYFPDLNQLNDRLNTPLGERVEHNTIKLMYRYARNNDLPFDYVELVFSKASGRPLYIHIYSYKDITDVFRTIEDKYGEPTGIDLPQETGRSIYWVDKKNVLLATTAPIRRGGQLYRLMIYFFDNIEGLVSMEEKERQEKEKGRRRAGEKAF